ncbi:MAG: hypothetical protein WC516_08720 [Patescibacteria group bacterium]|jgi:hypothetical protein
MKPWGIVLISLMGLIILLASVALYYEHGNVVELSDVLMDKEVIIQNKDNEISNLTNDNIALIQKSNLKSFENMKALNRFLESAKTYNEFGEDGYASLACINLMREAKESGYWMGLTAINTTDTSLWKAIVLDRMGSDDVQWRVWNVAIVGDSDVYLVDAKDKTGVYFIVTFNGDFMEYNKEAETKLLPYDGIGR